MSGELVICWDLVGTICDDDNLKPGLEDFLKRSTESGVTHFVTTGSNRNDAISDLGHIRPFFKQILGSEDFTSRDCKPYDKAAQIARLSPTQARHKMIVVGDKTSDQPTNMPGVVFVNYAQCCTHPNSVLEEIFDALINHGNGSFFRGFDVLDQRRLAQGAELTIFDSGTTFRQQQRDKDTRPLKEGSFTPAIYQITSPD